MIFFRHLGVVIVIACVEYASALFLGNTDLTKKSSLRYYLHQLQRLSGIGQPLELFVI